MTSHNLSLSFKVLNIGSVITIVIPSVFMNSFSSNIVSIIFSKVCKSLSLKSLIGYLILHMYCLFNASCPKKISLFSSSSSFLCSFFFLVVWGMGVAAWASCPISFPSSSFSFSNFSLIMCPRHVGNIYLGNKSKDYPTLVF